MFTAKKECLVTDRVVLFIDLVFVAQCDSLPSSNPPRIETAHLLQTTVGRCESTLGGAELYRFPDIRFNALSVIP